MNKAVDIISRKAETKTSLISAGNLNISLQQPSVLVIHGSSADVARYERQGNDLLIVMKDGSVIRCNGYFIEDSEQHHGELVFQDDTGALTHVTFGEMDPNAPMVTMILEPVETLIADIQPLLYASSESDYSWGMLAGALLGGAGIGALASSGGSDKTHTEYVDRPVIEPEQVITATFIVQDKTGDKQGLLNNKDITDETQPTFSGSGQPGATIQIKNESGQVIASAQVNADGKWQVMIPTQAAGTHTYSVVQIIGDKTTSAGDITLEVVTANATLSFSTVSDDNVINATEHNAAAVISGQSNGLAPGTPLVINLNGTPYLTTVGENGLWTVTVPAVDVSKLMDSQYVLTVTGKDSAGNTVTESHNIVVNTAAPVMIINTIGGDDILNAAEVAMNHTISGRVVNAEAGQQVKVSLNGKEYTTTVNADGTWSVDVPTEHLVGLANGTLSATASVTNKAGNTGHGDRDITIDSGLAAISIDTVAGDDIINAIELQQPLVISGTSSDLSQGIVITVHVNGKDYAASVTADGTWSIGIPANDVELFPAGILAITASANDISGNPVSNIHNATVDISPVAISIDAISGNNVLNAQEKNQDLVLTGLTENVEAGQIVTITVGSHNYQAEVALDGRWTATIPSVDLADLHDGVNHIAVSVSNVSGNSASSAQEVRVDTLAPTISIDTLAGDDILSADEATHDLVVSGTTVGAEAGQTVTVSLNGQDYTTTVNPNGSWSLSISEADLAQLPEGNINVTAKVTDKAGNESSVGHNILVDISAPTISIDTVAGDDVINSIEHGQSQVISGTTANAVIGDSITVTIGSNTYNTTVNADGSWSVGVPASVISGLQNGTATITATVTDKAGNSSSTEHDVLVNTAAPTLLIGTLAGDDIINASEKGLSLTINGSSTGVAEGLTVTVSLNGKNYTAQVDSAGHWTLDVPAADVAKLGEANYTVSASVTDAIGNATSATHDITVNTALPQVMINAIGGDDVLNNAEVSVAQTISGRVVNAEEGQTVTVTLGGKEYTTTVNAGGIWSVSVPSDDLKALGDGGLNVTATVTNQAGNEGSGDREIAIDAGLPGLRINTVAGDDIINAIELGQPLVINGTSTDLATGSVVTVTVNGKDYTASVNADGSWSLGVPAQDVAAFPEGQLAMTAQATDGSGNPVSHLHNVVVDLASVAISIDTIAGDNVLSAVEKGQDLVLTGSTQNVEAGQVVTVNVGGKNHLATVESDGSWSVTVSSADLAGLKDGTNNIAVSVSNVAGNGASAAQEVRVDTSAPTITINTLAGDDVLNAAEAAQPLTISGTTVGAEAGQTVTVSLNGHDYTTTVAANGSWTLNVDGADLAALAEGHVVITATVSDKAGNTSSATHNLLVDTLAPTITISTVAGDDVINAVEHGQSQIISGTTTHAVVGDAIAVVINGNTYHTTVNADGSWSVGVPASVIGALADGTATITATVTDKAGNSSDASHDVMVNTAAPTLTIATIAGDDIINATEKGLSLTINGTSTDVAQGLTVTVNLNGKTYTAIVGADGAWTFNVPAADVAKLGEASYTVSASVADTIGNTTSTTHDVLVNTAAPQVIINAIGGDDVLNVAEVSVNQTLSGRVVNAEAGQTVTVSLGGKDYTTTVNGDGTWSVSIPSADLTALGDGGLTVTATVTNQAGNQGQGDREIAIDAGLPGLRINTVAGDDIINAIELAQPLVINGTSTDLAAGSVVTVTVNGKDYTASVNADGSWSVGVPAQDVAAFPEGQLAMTAQATDGSGNPVSHLHNVVVDLATVAISIDTIAGDNVLSAVEKGQDLVLTGSTQNVEAGQVVTVNVGGKNHLVTVESDGSWSVTVSSADLAGLKDGTNNIAVSVSNVAGNGASAAQEVRVDTSAPTITINTLAGDDILNAAEAGQPLTISGATQGAEAGQTVTVTLNNQQYTTTVNANGSWTLNVDAADLAGLAEGNAVVTASVSDKAGNASSADRNLLVDTLAPTVAINTVAGDDVINSTEHGQSHIISGTTTNAVTGDSITVIIGSNTYNTTVNADGSWSVGVPASVISALQNGTATITATVTDKAGNSNSTDHQVVVNTTAPTLSISTLAGDDIINATEKGQSLTINGSSTGVAEGLTVTVSLNGKNYTAQVDSAGHWTLDVPAADVAKLGEANYTVSAQVTDAIGNATSATHDITVNTAAPQVIINIIGGDDILNADEVSEAQTISGRVVNAEEGQTVTVTLGGKEYTTTVNAGGTWSVSVPSDDLKALGDGGLNVTATVTNQAGNEGTGDREIAIDAGLPGLRINTVAGDDIINAIELGQPLVITGTSTGLAVGSVVTVTINGKDYVASVTADGSWSLGVSANEVAAFPAGNLVITANANDEGGNPAINVHNVTVDLAVVAISINTVAGDNILRAEEREQDLLLTGSTQNVEQGQTVTVNVGGKAHLATVDSDGNWAITVSPADLNGLKDGINNISVSVNNAAGNGASAAQEVRVDTVAPTINIDTVAGDNILNAVEAGQPLTISGTTVGAEAGQVVTVSLGGKNYSATVDADGRWTLDIPAENLASLPIGNIEVIASVSDKAGNGGTTSHHLLVDVTAPTITIHTVAGDDVINATEHAQAQIISGTTIDAVAGDQVSVTIGSKTYHTVVNADGNWSVGVPANVISALQNGTVTITATVTDKAGNSSSTEHDVLVNTAAPTLLIGTLAGDDIINAAEKGQSLTINGTSTHVGEGLTVTVTLNGKNYTTQVDSAGHWTLDVPAADVAKLGEANYTVSAQVTDNVGNSVVSTHDVKVNTAAPQVMINAVGGDDILNAAEVGVEQTISGRVINAEAGQTVTISLGGNTYTTTVNSGGTWSVNVSSADLKALGDGQLNITAGVTNKAGNEGFGERDIAISAGLPGLRIDTVAGDDIINAIELGQSLVITGNSVGLNAGSTVNVTINGKGYSASVNADGSWSVGVPVIDVGQFPAGTLVIAASGTDTSSNTVQVKHNVTVDLNTVAISIDSVADDNVISALEKGQDLLLTGQTQNVEAGQTVTVNIGGKTYDVNVNANGSWSVNVPAADLNGLKEGMNNVSVSVKNAAGNSASAAQDVRVDTSSPTVTINTIAGDDILNAAEAGQPLTISGMVIGAEAGQTVTISLGGKNYTTTVKADGSWLLDVAANNVGALTNGNVIVTAKVADKAGNEGSSSHNLLVDTFAPGITIATVAGDNIINATEHAQEQVIRGSTTNAVVGDKIVVTIDGHSYNTTVNADGSWSVGVPVSVISALQDGSATITATVTDKAGNSSSVSQDILVSTASPTLNINVIAGDNIINATEKGQDLTISGTSQNVAAGLTVTVTLNGKTYTALVAGDGGWTLNVPANDVAALGEANYIVNASVTDSVGNAVNANHNVVVNTGLPGITIDTVAGDNVINATEIQSAQTISGKVYNVEVGQTVTVTINGETYQATVQTGGKWSVSVAADDWQAIGNGNIVVTAEVTNHAGNSGQGTHNVVIDANLPGIRIGAISGDDVINIIEHGQDLIIKGSSEGFNVGAILKVTVNGITYDATVGKDGNWLVDVSAIDVSNFPAGTLTVTAQGQNAIGESVSNSHLVQVDLASTAITINTVAGDDIINAAEKGQAVTLGGSVVGIEVGQLVTLVIGGMTYTTTVLSGGNWTYTLSANAVSKLAEGNLDITVNVENQSGNSASAGRQVVVNSQVPAININTISGDDMINSAEHTQSLTINGTSYGLESGREVTVTINGLNYTTLVAKDGSWTLDVPANIVSGLADGSYQITASASNVAGNSSSANHSVIVDTMAPTVAIDNVTSDNMLNAEEHANNQVISGTSNAIGQMIYVTIGGETYSTEVRKDGTWIVGVPSTVINGLNEGTNTVEVSVADKAGNVVTSSKDFEVIAGVPTLSINAISGDNVINQLEHGGNLEISGTASTSLIGREVTVTLNGKNYTATVDGTGAWTLTIDAAEVGDLSDSYYKVTASATDISGNSANGARDLALDLVPPSLTVSDIAIDNVVNAIEHGNAVTIKGSYGGAENGQLVTVTLNGKDYSVAVTGNGSWSITVPASDVQNLIDGDYNVKVSLSDKAGNKVSVDKPLVVDTTAPEISINAVTGDDSISVTEQAAGVTINGTTTAEVGQTVSVNFNGRNYSATVTAENTWTINVPSNHFNGIVDGTYPVTVTVSDNAGNNSTLSHNVTVVTKLPSLTIDTFAGDNVVNGDEHQQSQVISGTSDAIGQFVTVTLNGKTYSNIQVENNGTWRVTVSATDMLALNEGLTKIVASVSSATGNGYSTESTIEVDLTPPAAQVVINSITNDTGVSSSDYITSDTKFVINGSINGSLAAGEYAEISLDNGATWKKLTLINGLWTLNNGTTDWAEGEHTYYMRVVDAAGNVGVVTNHKVTVDTTAPDQVISVSHITDDTGTYDNDFVTYDTTPSLFGALSRELGSDETLQIRLDSGIWVTVANVTGKDWQFDTATALTEGSHTYELRVIDLAGNTSSVVSKDITVDVTPSTISTTIVSFTDNVGTNQSNYPSGTETDDTLPTLNGTLIGKLGSGDVVRIYVDGVWAGNATVSGTTWTYDIKTALSEGQHTFTAVVTDLAGNEGTPSPEFSLVIDTIAPTETATIVSYTDDVGLYQGNFGSGTYTDDTNVVLNGTLSGAIKATDVVRVYEGNTLLGTATVNGTDWTFNLNGLSEGTHTYHVVVSDVAGNESPASNNFVMNVDITAPTSVITVDTKLTADTTPTITGTVTNLGADERLWINVNGVIYREGIDNALSINRITNTWALVIDNAHALNADGVLNQVYNVDARITDKAGNFSEVSSKDQLTVYSDTAIIRSPSFDYMAETQPAFIIKGTAGTGETMIVEVRNAGGTLIKTFSSADGSLVKTADGSYTIASSAWGTTKLVSGEYSINSYVNVADGSGGQASTTEYFTVIEPNTAQNVTNANDDSASRVYATSDGGYWMFWASGTTATGNTYNLYAQRYDQSGNKVGSQVTISNDSGQNNANNLQYIRLYDVYMKEDNSFSVFYSSGAAQIPYLQNFDVNGAAVGARVSITNTLAFELTPTYVSMADGGYALVFNSGTISNYNVYAIRYDANGTALDARPVALTTGTNYNNGFAYVLGGYVGQPTGTGTSTATTTQGMSAVDIGDSKYAVLYMSSKPGSVGGTDMYMKVIDFKTGNEVSGSEIMANAFTDKMQIGASMVALKGGGFIAAWASNTGSAGNNYGTMDGFDVYARRFTWDVATQKLVALDATEVRVNTSTDGVNGVAYNALSVNMDVAALEQGGYVVVWSKFTAANKSDVYAQSFDAAGNKLGGETLISTNNANLDSLPSVTALADGGYVVSWDSMTTTANYLNGYKNDINSVIVNADGTIRGTGDTNSYSPTASYLDGSGTLTGDAAVNTLDGRHGATVMNAGAGNDYIIINNTNFTSIDGGTGFDTLIWNSANNLNFSDISNKVTGIEAIHMGDEYANVLSLTLQDVLNASDTTDVLVVQGGVTDSVNLTDTGWYSVGSQIWRGDTYQVLLNTYDINASLWVQNGVVVKNNATAMLMNPASLSGSEESDVITMDNNHQVINIGNSGHDTLLYKLLNSADATGGNDHSVVNGFTVGSWENTSDTDRIDLSSLLQGSGYNGSATASYVNGIATLGSETGNIEDYINVRVENGNTVISIDRDGAGNSYNSTDLVTISGVQTDLATLLANHQLLVV